MASAPQQTLGTASIGPGTSSIFSINDSLQCRVAAATDPFPTTAAPAFIRNVNQTGLLLLRQYPQLEFDYGAVSVQNGTFGVNTTGPNYTLVYDTTTFGVLSASFDAITTPAIDKPFYIFKDAAASSLYGADGNWIARANADIYNTQWQLCIPIITASAITVPTASSSAAPATGIVSSGASIFQAPAPVPAPVPPPAAPRPTAQAAAPPVQPALTPVVTSQPASASASAAPAPALAVTQQPASASASASVAPSLPAVTPATAPVPPQNTNMATVPRLPRDQVFIVSFTDGYEITKEIAQSLAAFFLQPSTQTRSRTGIATNTQVRVEYTANKFAFCFPFITSDTLATSTPPYVLTTATRSTDCQGSKQTAVASIQKPYPLKAYYLALYGKKPVVEYKNSIVFNGNKLTIHDFKKGKYEGFINYNTDATEPFKNTDDADEPLPTIDASELPADALQPPPNAKGTPPPGANAKIPGLPTFKTNTILLTVPPKTPTTASEFTYNPRRGFITNLLSEMVSDFNGAAAALGLAPRNRA